MQTLIRQNQNLNIISADRCLFDHPQSEKSLDFEYRIVLSNFPSKTLSDPIIRMLLRGCLGGLVSLRE